MSASPFNSRGGDGALYGSLRPATGSSKTGGRRTSSIPPAAGNTRTALLHGNSTDSVMATLRRRKSRAVSSRSRLLLLPSFAESWRVEQSLLMSGDDPEAAGGAEHGHLEQSTWVHACGIIIGEILGSGVLGLPGAFAGLGYFLGTICCVVFCLFAVYSGVILARVRNDFFPGVERYADAAGLTGSLRFKSLTRWSVHINWLFLLPYYVMTIAHSLQLALSPFPTLCFSYYTLIAAGFLLIFLQFRTLSGLAYAAMISDVAIIVAIVMILWSISTNDGRGGGGGGGGNLTAAFDHSDAYGALPNVGTSSTAPSSSSSSFLQNDPWWPSPGSFLQVYGRTSTMVFAFQGQSIYFEIMREMKDSRDFGKAVTYANSFMGVVYLVTCVIVTAFSFKFLRSVPEFLPNAIPADNVVMRSIVGTLLSYHVTMSYILTNQPLSNALHAMISPETLLDYDTYRGRLIWCVITTTLLSFSVVIANTIPFFSTFQALVGSLMGAPLMFGLPAYFYWRASWDHDKTMERFDIALCLIFLFVFLPVCTVCGTVSAVQQLIDDWATSGLPFQCHTT